MMADLAEAKKRDADEERLNAIRAKAEAIENERRARAQEDEACFWK
jgi:hypothetical protein